MLLACEHQRDRNRPSCRATVSSEPPFAVRALAGKGEEAIFVVHPTSFHCPRTEGVVLGQASRAAGCHALVMVADPAALPLQVGQDELCHV